MIVDLFMSMTESLIFAWFSGKYINVSRKSMARYCIITAVLLSLVTTGLYYVETYEILYTAIPSSVLFLMMWKYRDRQLADPVSTILIYILLWNIMLFIGSDIAAAAGHIFHQEIPFAEYISRNDKNILLHTDIVIIAAVLYLINYFFKDYRYLSSRYSPAFAFSFSMLFLCVFHFDKEIFSGDSEYIIKVVFNSLLFMVSLLQYWIFNRSAYDNYELFQQKHLASFTKTVKENELVYAEKEEELRRMRHDMKNQLIVLDGYLNSGNTDQCRDKDQKHFERS